MRIDGYNFTKRMQATLWAAHALHHPLIGTEHLLLGMIAESRGIAAQVLADSGIDLDKARKQVVAVRERMSDDEDNEVPVGEQPAIVRVMLEYMNGATLSKRFTTTREASAFLEGAGRV